MSSRLVATAAFSVSTFFAVGTSAETQSEIRAIIGDIDLVEASLFTANRAFYQMICPPYDYEHLATLVSRLEYGSLTSEERGRYEAILTSQSKGNLALKEQIETEAQERDICRSLKIEIGEYIIAFRERYPGLLER